MKEQYNKSIERARWFLTEYAEYDRELTLPCYFFCTIINCRR